MSEERDARKAAVYQALCACLGLPPESDAAALLLHPCRAEPEPMPQAPRTQDAVYYALLPDDRAEPLPTMLVSHGREGSEKPVSLWGVLAFRLQLICYGPNAEENAERIRRMLYLDGAGNPRAILRQAGIWPVPDPPQAQVLAETENSLYRFRADLAVPLRARQELKARLPGAVSAPDIVLHRR